MKAEVYDGTGVPSVTAIQGVMRRKTRIQRGKNLRSGYHTEALGLSQSSFKWQGDIVDLCGQELIQAAVILTKRDRWLEICCFQWGFFGRKRTYKECAQAWWLHHGSNFGPKQAVPSLDPSKKKRWVRGPIQSPHGKKQEAWGQGHRHQAASVSNTVCHILAEQPQTSFEASLSLDNIRYQDCLSSKVTV